MSAIQSLPLWFSPAATFALCVGYQAWGLWRRAQERGVRRG